MKFKFKNNKTALLVALMAGITIFSAYKYIVSIKEKYDLTHQLNDVKTQADALSKEKQNLLQTLEKEKKLNQQLFQENSGLQNSLKLSTEKVNQLENDLTLTQRAVEELNSQATALQVENTKIKADNAGLQNNLTSISQENENLKVKLSSITELKKAMGELKSQMRKVRHQIQKKIDTEQIQEGNRGFVVKQGKSTFPAKVKIEVNPATK